MKKSFLIIFSMIMLSVSGNCQWLKKHYGVNEFNQLSQEQLNDALRRVNNGVKCGTILSVTGVIGIGSGIIIILANQDKDFGGLGGLLLLEASVPIEIAGILLWSTNGKRVKSIKEVLKSTELKMGLINCHHEYFCSGSKGFLLPCLSLTMEY